MQFKRFYLAFIITLLFSCDKQTSDTDNSINLEINDFIWKGLNTYYLWKDYQPDLADNRFANQTALNAFLQQQASPEIFFNDLLYKPGDIDRWSWIVDDYDELLSLFAGITKTTGIHLGLVYVPGSNTDLFAYIKYVVPQSPAAQNGFKRGDLFRKINGQSLNLNNYQELLNTDIWQIELAQWDGNNLISTGQIKTIEKIILQENPIYLDTVYNYNQYKIGYLIYNGFVSNYTTDLSDVFEDFKARQIDRLIIDLRYNPGGSVQTLQYLASMITGQFTGQILLKYQWHSQLQNWMSQNYPDHLIRKFLTHQENGVLLPQLNMSQIVFITTKNSASASESLINGLKPYIKVTQIGTATHGKYTASISLFDSPDFSLQNCNPDHKWAMQPIVLKISNVDGYTDFYNGLQPDILQAEDYFNLGYLGQTDEPLLQTALEYISTQNIPHPTSLPIAFNEQTYQSHPLEFDMHVQFKDLKSPRFF